MPAAGGALVVSNHSGGMFTPDVLVFAPAFYEKFGFDRPMYTLAPLRRLHRPMSETGCAAPASSRPTARTPRRRCGTARWCWCSPAATTTRTGRRSPRTSSTSTAAPATSGPPSSRRADRADGVDRRAGDPIVPRPWRFDRQAARAQAGCEPRFCRSASGSRSGFRCSSRRTCRCPPRSSPGCSSRSTSSPSSARTPTSTRSTSTFAP